jgi:Fungal Zn(2)-Cys(6) binuclear cluster domain
MPLFSGPVTCQTRFGPSTTSIEVFERAEEEDRGERKRTRILPYISPGLRGSFFLILPRLSCFIWQEVVDMAMPLRDLAPATSPPRNLPSSTLSTRRRQKSYQACEHCRRRKAKCELEEVHGTIASSCVRCRRERKKCVFSAERSAKLSKSLLTQSHGPDGSPDSGPYYLLVIILFEVASYFSFEWWLIKRMIRSTRRR